MSVVHLLTRCTILCYVPVPVNKACDIFQLKQLIKQSHLFFFTTSFSQICNFVGKKNGKSRFLINEKIEKNCEVCISLGTLH